MPGLSLRQRLSRQRLVALFVAGLLVFNFPLLALWDGQARLWGLPLFPLMLLVLWLALVLVLGLLAEHSPD